MKQVWNVLAAGVFLSVAGIGQEQTLEYGEANELRGLSRIYVYTGTDLDVRRNIIKEIKKKLPSLVFTDGPETAEIALVFSADSSRFLAQMQSSTVAGTTTTRPVYRDVISANASVIKFVGPGRIRLLLNFTDSRATIFERRPSTNFARKFIQAYKVANGLTKGSN